MDTTIQGASMRTCDFFGDKRHSSLSLIGLLCLVFFAPVGVLAIAGLVNLARILGWKGGHRSTLVACRDNNVLSRESMWQWAIFVGAGTVLNVMLAAIVPLLFIPSPSYIPASGLLTVDEIFGFKVAFFWGVNAAGGLLLLIFELVSARKAQATLQAQYEKGGMWRVSE